jgi:hypothetical protein
LIINVLGQFTQADFPSRVAYGAATPLIAGLAFFIDMYQ